MKQVADLEIKSRDGIITVQFWEVTGAGCYMWDCKSFKGHVELLDWLDEVIIVDGSDDADTCAVTEVPRTRERLSCCVAECENLLTIHDMKYCKWCREGIESGEMKEVKTND